MTSNWSQVKSFYASVLPEIMKEEKSKWGIDPYAWDQAGITFTPIEKWLWHDIRAVDAVLYPQFPVFGFFVDFANPKAKVAIECDGAEFHKDKEKDSSRDKKLRDAGWSVYRISGKDCRNGVGMEDEWNSNARKFINNIAELHNIKAVI